MADILSAGSSFFPTDHIEKRDVLTLEEIEASTSLEGKVASAEAVKRLNSDIHANNAGSHNSIYRGKYLGNTLTASQKAQISAGTFDDLYIGDYWIIGGVSYCIAHFDYWMNCGDSSCTRHHIVIVPDTCLYSAQMHNTASGGYESGAATNSTSGAYVGSDMYKTGLNRAKEIINNAFGSAYILNHRELLTNATNSSSDPCYASSGSWYDSTVELMNEQMVYGCQVFTNVQANGSIPYSYTIDKSQLALFRLNPSLICNRADWWLRGVVSAARFACATGAGDCGDDNASRSFGVRPVFGIIGKPS